MKYLRLSFIVMISLICSCSTEDATEQERIYSEFINSLGGNVSAQQWWRTSVTLTVNVTTDEPVKMWLLFTQNEMTVLCDYKELSTSGTVTMTAPQGQGDTLNLTYVYKKKMYTQSIVLSGKSQEFVSLNTASTTRAHSRADSTPESLSGSSIRGNAEYYQFTTPQLDDYYSMMNYSKNNVDAKVQGLNTNYELKSHGPFYITWVNGYEAEQRSRILGYYYHSPYTYDDMEYVDLSETHKWDYIDGLSKVQYQIDYDDIVDGYQFKAHTWYDANFDMYDTYGSKRASNNDRLGDNAYNSQMVFNRYGEHISALRGISFLVDVPEGTRIGFYLRSDEEPDPKQWNLLKESGIPPYTSNQNEFKGTCFCAEAMNMVGNGRGKHRSFVQDFNEVIWMGMEDLLNGGDHDCNDVIFGVVADLEIHMPEIVDPGLLNPDDPNPDDPNPDDPNPDDPNPDNPNPDNPDVDDSTPLPWTIAFEDVYRDPDFDFNDAVIKVIPDYENERCCIMVMAAGSPSRMYLHYDGPEGDQNMGEIHDLLASSQTYINTKGALANTPFVTIDCVPWPKGYTMADDAKRFYIEIQRGTCDDCTDVITLALEPGKMPEALLVAGEWHWPMEGNHIFSTYGEFPNWAQDVTRTRFWEWYKTPEMNSFVSY